MADSLFDRVLLLTQGTSTTNQAVPSTNATITWGAGMIADVNSNNLSNGRAVVTLSDAAVVRTQSSPTLITTTRDVTVEAVFEVNGAAGEGALVASILDSIKITVAGSGLVNIQYWPGDRSLPAYYVQPQTTVTRYVGTGKVYLYARLSVSSSQQLFPSAPGYSTPAIVTAQPIEFVLTPESGAQVTIPVAWPTLNALPAQVFSGTTAEPEWSSSPPSEFSITMAVTQQGYLPKTSAYPSTWSAESSDTTVLSSGSIGMTAVERSQAGTVIRTLNATTPLVGLTAYQALAVVAQAIAAQQPGDANLPAARAETAPYTYTFPPFTQVNRVRLLLPLTQQNSTWELTVSADASFTSRFSNASSTNGVFCYGSGRDTIASVSITKNSPLTVYGVTIIDSATGYWTYPVEDIPFLPVDQFAVQPIVSIDDALTYIQGRLPGVTGVAAPYPDTRVINLRTSSYADRIGGIAAHLRVVARKNLATAGGISKLYGLRITAANRPVSASFPTLPWDTTNIPPASGAPLPSEVLFAVNAENNYNDVSIYGATATVTGSGTITRVTSGSRTGDAYINNSSGAQNVDAGIYYTMPTAARSIYESSTVMTLEFDIYPAAYTGSEHGNTYWMGLLGIGAASHVSFSPSHVSLECPFMSSGGGATVQYAQWSHVAFVADSVANEVKTYVNGVLQNTVVMADGNTYFGPDFVAGVQYTADTTISLMQIKDRNDLASLKGRLDNVVLTASKKYTANFTPPTTGVTGGGSTPNTWDPTFNAAFTLTNNGYDTTAPTYSMNGYIRGKRGLSSGTGYFEVTVPSGSTDMVGVTTRGTNTLYVGSSTYDMGVWVSTGSVYWGGGTTGDSLSLPGTGNIVIGVEVNAGTDQIRFHSSLGQTAWLSLAGAAFYAACSDGDSIGAGTSIHLNTGQEPWVLGAGSGYGVYGDVAGTAIPYRYYHVCAVTKPAGNAHLAFAELQFWENATTRATGTAWHNSVNPSGGDFAGGALEDGSGVTAVYWTYAGESMPSYFSMNYDLGTAKVVRGVKYMTADGYPGLNGTAFDVYGSNASGDWASNLDSQTSWERLGRVNLGADPASNTMSGYVEFNAPYVPPPSNVDVTGAGHNDLEDLVCASTGNTQDNSPDAYGTSNATLDDFTVATTAYVDAADVTGTGSATLAAYTNSGAGVAELPTDLTGDNFLDDFTCVADGVAELPMEFTADYSLEDFTSVAVGLFLAPIEGAGDAVLEDSFVQDFSYFVETPGVVSAAIVIPTLIVEAVATSSRANGVTATLSPITLSAQFGGGASMTLPFVAVGASATVTQVASADLTLPTIRVTATGRVSEQVAAQVQLTSMYADAYGGHQAAMTLPSITASAAVVGGSTATLTARLPMLTTQASGYRMDTMRATLTLPAIVRTTSGAAAIALPQIIVASSAQPALTAAYEAYVLNMNQPLDDNPRNNFEAKNEQVTRYTNWPFIQVVRLGTTYYGVAADGLYELGGETDNGTEIAWSFETCKTDFKDPHKKTVASAYVAGQSSADVAYTLRSGDDTDRMYDYATTRVTQKRNHRQKFGLGRRVRYYSFGLAGEGKAAIDSIEFELTTTTRRV